MTIIDCPTTTCTLQEQAYTDGWRDYAANQIVGNAGQYRGQYRKFYAKGWADHQRRDQRPAMYARKDSPG